jgi:hypothetical protein
MSIRVLLAVVVACTVGLWFANFAVLTLGPDDARTAAERTVPAIPFISLAAVVVLALLRHQVRSRQLTIAGLERPASPPTMSAATCSCWPTAAGRSWPAPTTRPPPCGP